MRIATNRVQIIGATMHTTTMACCWVEGSVLTTIVDWCGVYRERVPKKKKKPIIQSGQMEIYVQGISFKSEQHYCTGSWLRRSA